MLRVVVIRTGWSSVHANAGCSIIRTQKFVYLHWGLSMHPNFKLGSISSRERERGVIQLTASVYKQRNVFHVR
jgi:hypothetical protein